MGQFRKIPNPKHLFSVKSEEESVQKYTSLSKNTSQTKTHEKYTTKNFIL
jgi:hypothetical protein